VGLVALLLLATWALIDVGSVAADGALRWINLSTSDSR